MQWSLAIMLMSILSLVFFLVPNKVQAEKDVHHEELLHVAEEASSHDSHEVDSHKDHSSDDHAAHEEGFNAGEMIMHHIGDANAFHIVGDIYIPLPVIIYNKTEGSWFTGLSTDFDLDHHGNSTNEVEGFHMHHGRVLPSMQN